jgi:serine/threonine protein phosphatase PrpC
MLESKGCTANVVMIREAGNTIYCANAGDSRCVMGKKGKAVNLSMDHKPELAKEKARITRAGSSVVEGRVDGNLNLSRSIGDLKYKKAKHLKVSEHPITCVPDVKKFKITKDCDFLVIACDGIWEDKSS